MTNRAFVLAVALVASSCGSLDLTNGGLQCSDRGQCPSGYYCAVDDHCWEKDTGPTPEHDLAMTRDVATTDSAVADDGAAAFDLATAFDLAEPELSEPDLAAFDLVAPDLATPDLTVSDMTMPDLTTRDLATPDLLPLPDLTPPPDLAAAPTCNDGKRNGNETDVDCGGGICPRCLNGKGCLVPSDCLGGACGGKICRGLDFAQAVPYQADSATHSIATADFNGDGKIDLVTANINGNNVTFLAGIGNGTFQVGMNFPAGVNGPNPRTVAFADFNNDMKWDLVTANSSSANVGVLLGNGNGTFQPVMGASAGQQSAPFSLTVADLNADGKSDVVVADGPNGAAVVLIGKGTGSFNAPVPYGVGTFPYAVTTGDFNGDGKLDIVTSNYTSNNVSVLAGNGDGTFLASVPFAAGVNPGWLAAGEFNGDGRLDLVTANGVGTVSILLRNANGTFQPPVPYPAGMATLCVATADLNGDGSPDVVAANADSNNVSVFLGNGNGTLAAAVDFSVGKSPRFVTARDLNNDGRVDLAVANEFDNNVSVLLNTSN